MCKPGLNDDKKCGVGLLFFPILVAGGCAADVKFESQLTPLISQTMVCR